MKIKVEKLSGAALDWAVAIAEGTPKKDLYLHPSGVLFRDDADGYRPDRSLSFSSKWLAGGPIIERERIDVISDPNGTAGWLGRNYTDGREVRVFAATPLVAAMRCYVAYKLGEEIEVNDDFAVNLIVASEQSDYVKSDN